jgi:hypothetical protein
MQHQSGKLIRQPAYFPHRDLGGGTPASKACFHARSPTDGFLTSLPDCC